MIPMLLWGLPKIESAMQLLPIRFSVMPGSMNTAAFILEAVLLLWFFGCIVTYRFGKVYLVEGMGVKSAEFGMLVAFSVGVVLRIAYPALGNWVTLAVLAFWLAVQYFCHWHYTIFGASQKKIDGYNRCFAGTLCLVPRRNDRVIPDFYHIVLHILLLLNIVFLLLAF